MEKKELKYCGIRESIVLTFSALRKLYVEILLIEGGTREERYAGEILLNILQKRISLCLFRLLSRVSHLISSYSVCIEISLVVPLTILAASVCILSNSCFFV